ncbi:MAG TPA: NifB/NifX family molybdenum-iron cluster-binding protein [Acidobacteriota bacterium]|nr:NifB/NifX family molybdenum-iron cluster-binding protein [Acidobacteriota bacterium]
MRIAVPQANGRLAQHFGHCPEFVFFDVDLESKTIVAKEVTAAPEHQPGLLPAWLASRNAQLVIAGGMGGRAIALFDSHGIQVLLGAPPEPPENIVQAYLAGNLRTGANICDH